MGDKGGTDALAGPFAVCGSCARHWGWPDLCSPEAGEEAWLAVGLQGGPTGSPASMCRLPGLRSEGHLIRRESSAERECLCLKDES